MAPTQNNISKNYPIFTLHKNLGLFGQSGAKLKADSYTKLAFAITPFKLFLVDFEFARMLRISCC